MQSPSLRLTSTPSMITPTPQTAPDSTEVPPQVPMGKSTRPLLVRIGVGLIGSVFYLAMVFVQPNGLPFALGVAVFSILGVSELYRAVQKQGGEPTEFLGYVACIVFQ